MNHASWIDVWDRGLVVPASAAMQWKEPEGRLEGHLCSGVRRGLKGWEEGGEAVSSEADGAPQVEHGGRGCADGRPGTRPGVHRVRTLNAVRAQQVRERLGPAGEDGAEWGSNFPSQLPPGHRAGPWLPQVFLSFREEP